MRLTMKPGVERACTGVLPQRRLSSKIASATAGSVCRPDTTSTSFISGTGLKKCMPTKRPGPLQAVGERRDRDRRGVGGEDAVVVDAWPRARGTGPLGVDVLDDRLDHQADAGRLVEPRRPARCGRAPPSPRRRRACPWRPGRRASVASLVQAAAAAPSRASNSRTACPAWAATWAMPAPMMPAPTTSTGVPAPRSMFIRPV